MNIAKSTTAALPNTLPSFGDSGISFPYSDSITICRKENTRHLQMLDRIFIARTKELVDTITKTEIKNTPKKDTRKILYNFSKLKLVINTHPYYMYSSFQIVHPIKYN